MVILGLNYYFHDSTACILVNGELIAAIEEERLNRDKHTRVLPQMAVDRCLKIANLSYSDIDYIAVSIKPTHNFWRKLSYALGRLRTLKTFINHEYIHAYNKQKGFWNWYKFHWENKKLGPKVHFIPHHFSHAPGSFFVSPYKEAALLGIDGSGEWATTWLGYGKDNKVSCLGESFFPHSLGSFYEAVTQFCGFRTSYDEGKTWEDISQYNGLPSFPWGIVGIAISPVNSKRIWMMIEASDGGLYRSDDGGNNWKKVQSLGRSL